MFGPFAVIVGIGGACCRNIRLNVNLSCLTKLEIMVVMATYYHVDEWMGNTGTPFIPEYKTEDDGWRFSCPRLTEEGTCGGYENRPNLCRIFVPGYHQPCAMNSIA